MLRALVNAVPEQEKARSIADIQTYFSVGVSSSF